MDALRVALSLTAALAVSGVHAQGAASYVSEKVTQRAQQLAAEGANMARAAYANDGLYGVAKLSSDCIAQAKAGRVSSHQCLGVEAVGLTVRKQTPSNTTARTALDWFSDREMTNRVYTYCFSFLGLHTDMACAQTFSTAKNAADAVTAGMPPFAADQQAAASALDKGEVQAVLSKYGPTNISCGRASGTEKRLCTNQRLGQLHGLMSATYQSRLKPPFGASSSKMQDAQWAWRDKTLNKCSDTDDHCIERAYVVRIAQLCQIPVPAGVKPASDCDVIED
jgi:hypothetical protein